MGRAQAWIYFMVGAPTMWLTFKGDRLSRVSISASVELEMAAVQLGGDMSTCESV